MSQKHSTIDMASFRDFVKTLDHQGLLNRRSPSQPEEINDGLTDETTLRRFFDARLGQVDDAVQQFKDSVETRELLEDTLLYCSIDVADYESTRALYPHWTGHRDKQGRPVCMFDIAKLDSKAIAGYKKSRGIGPALNQNGGGEKESEINAAQRALVFHDTLTRFILPLCSMMHDRPNLEQPVSSAVYLVDVAKFGVKQGWDLRDYAQDISKLLATVFPEVIDTVFVLNAPIYFGKIWSMLKKWVDPRTAEKLVILTPKEVLPRLKQTIDFSSVPSQFGGELQFQHGGLPRLDMAMCKQLLWLSEPTDIFPTGPVKWIVDDNDCKTAVAVGRLDGAARFKTIFRLMDAKSDC